MFFEKTHGEELIQMIEDNSPKVTDIIKQYIDSHDTSKMMQGVRYYNNESDVLGRKKTYYKDGQLVYDNAGLKPNNKIPHNYHKVLVDQKVSYIVGKPITMASDDEVFTDLINEHFNDEFDDMANELVKGAANKGKEWLHVYVNSNGEFDYIIIPAQQVIPIYENTKRRTLEAVIRYYSLDDDTLKIELWDKKQVTYFESDQNGEIVLDMSYDVNPQSHFYFGTSTETKGYGWERVPFIKFANNQEEHSDLKFYKELIDEFDKTVSETSNNLEEIQDLIYVLKGYEGENLSEFMQNLMYYKAIKVDEDGGVDTKQAEIPTQSKDSHLDRIEEAIWTFGQGVRVNTDKFGQSPSGTALKFLYTLLDLKANQVERKFRKGLKEMMWFFAEYLGITGKGEHDPDTVDYTFNRTMITNDLEKVEMAAKSKGVISDQTVISNHPWVDDYQQEKERMEEEMSAYPSLEGEGIGE